ncbi:MAG: hypothetical protein IPM49_18505 [Flavobacteriales bacterium]|nr:hypothetical protein [Flavobacteriales bacterium]
MTLKAPYPWFGGKSKIMREVWKWLGDTPNFVDPFLGSGASVLGRPPWYGTSARASSDNDIRAFHDRYLAGEPVATLAEEAGVKPVTVHDWFRGLGLPLKTTPPAKRTCSNCGRVVQELRHGRCNSCYQWHRTHNEERPLKADVREPLRRARLAPDDVVLKLHARYMDGEGITALATEVGIGRVTLWRRFADLGLEQRGHNVPRPCSMCGRKMVLNEHGICRSCTREAARFRCPRCSIVVPVELAKGEVCDMCKDDAAHRAAIDGYRRVKSRNGCG